jgi:hypothetical protein
MMNKNDEEKETRRESRRHPVFVRLFGMMMGRLFFAVIFALLLAVVVMWLWNWLLPGLLGIGEIGFWQAFGLMILARLVLGTIGPGWGAHPVPSRSPWGDRFKHYQDRCNDMGHRRHFDKTMLWWHNYKEFWRDEGKAAFDEYLKKKKKEGTDEKKTKA